MPDLDPSDCIVNFGSLPPLPEGYAVVWHDNIEQYMAHGPNDWESAICWDRYRVRRWCFEHATRGDE